MTAMDVLSFVVGLLTGVLLTVASLTGLVIVLVLTAMRRTAAQGVERVHGELARQVAAASRAARGPATGQES